MECRLIQSKAEWYLQGNLNPEEIAGFQHHLENCRTCAQFYSLYVIHEKHITVEKATGSSPFLSSRVMAAIEQQDCHGYHLERSLLFKAKPILVAASLLVAVFLGVMAGSLAGSPIQAAEAELFYLDDASLELVQYLNEE